MKKFVNFFFAVLCAGAVMNSCTKEVFNGELSDDSEFSLSVMPSSPDGAGEAFLETKSVFNDIDKVTDVNFFVFDTAGNLVSNNYFSTNSNISAKTLFLMTNGQRNSHSYRDSFDVYVVANVGDVHNNSTLKSISTIGSYTYDFSNKSNLQSLIAAKGLPMAAIYENYCPATDTKSLLADRLVSEYHISFTKPSGNSNLYTINSGVIKDMSRKVLPFGSSYCIASGDGCIGSFEDFGAQTVNASGYLTVYALENVHGSTPEKSYIYQAKNKTKASLNDSYKESRVTYLELDVTVDDKVYAVHEVKYRYYFGNGNNDFSVYRNKIVNLNINFDDMEIIDNGWRIDEQEVDPYIPELITDIDDLYVAQKVTLTSNMACDWEIYEADNEDMVVLSSDSSCSSTDLYCLGAGWFVLRMSNPVYTDSEQYYDIHVKDPVLKYRFDEDDDYEELTGNLSTTMYVDNCTERDFYYQYYTEDDEVLTYDSSLSYLLVINPDSGVTSWGRNHNFVKNCYHNSYPSSGSSLSTFVTRFTNSDSENIFYYLNDGVNFNTINLCPNYYFSYGSENYTNNKWTLNIRHPFAGHITSGDCYSLPSSYIQDKYYLSMESYCWLYPCNSSYPIRVYVNDKNNVRVYLNTSSLSPWTSTPVYSSKQSGGYYDIQRCNFNYTQNGGSAGSNSRKCAVMDGLDLCFEFSCNLSNFTSTDPTSYSRSSYTGELVLQSHSDRYGNAETNFNYQLMIGVALGYKTYNSKKYFKPIFVNKRDDRNFGSTTYLAQDLNKIGSLFKVSSSYPTTQYSSYSGDVSFYDYAIASPLNNNDGICFDKLYSSYRLLDAALVTKPETITWGSTATDANGQTYLTSFTCNTTVNTKKSMNYINYVSFAYFYNSMILDTSKVTSSSCSYSGATYSSFYRLDSYPRVCIVNLTTANINITKQ